MFSHTDKVLTIIYHSDDHIGRQIIAYAQAEKIDIQYIDLKSTPLSGAQWADLSSRLGIKPKEMINPEAPNLTQKFGKNTNLSDHDWLTLLVHNPDIVAAPIVMKGDKIAIMNNPQDMLHFV